MKSITVILGAYNRGYVLNEQIESIKNQTIKPKEIIVYYNKGTEEQIEPDDPSIKVVKLNFNSKFHGRFAFALLSQTEYVAIFDDDTIPGEKWFENCINCMNKQEGIYGTSGVVLTGEAYNPHYKVGWNGKRLNDIIQPVHLVGHAWFFKKEYLKYMWMEEPLSWDSGEDMHFSYMAKKYGNIKTLVPPHPPNDISLWGSTQGVRLGTDKYGMSCGMQGKKSLDVRNMIASNYIKEGWKI